MEFTLDKREMACRIVEAINKVHRPDGMNVEQAFAALPADSQVSSLAAADAVCDYFLEQINETMPVVDMTDNTKG